MAKEIKRIALIGSGLMSRGIGMLFAQHGYDVKLFYLEGIDDIDVARGVIEENLNFLADNELVVRENIPEILSHISFTSSLEEAGKFGDLVIEALIEKLEVKQEYFEKLDSICSVDTIITSNTSVISITEIASRCTHKERILGTHFWNPAYLIPLVEVVRTVDVSDDTVTKTCNILRSVNKQPIVVKKDVPGFLANRLQHALVREAFAIVEDGVADPKDVDDAIKYGFGLRLPYCGPFEQADSNGMDLTLNIQNYIYKYLDNRREPTEYIKNKVAEGRFGFKTGGHGAFDWTEEEMAEFRKNSVDNLVKICKVMNVL